MSLQHQQHQQHQQQQQQQEAQFQLQLHQQAQRLQSAAPVLPMTYTFDELLQLARTASQQVLKVTEGKRTVAESNIVGLWGMLTSLESEGSYRAFVEWLDDVRAFDAKVPAQLGSIGLIMEHYVAAVQKPTADVVAVTRACVVLNIIFAHFNEIKEESFRKRALELSAVVFGRSIPVIASDWAYDAQPIPLTVGIGPQTAKADPLIPYVVDYFIQPHRFPSPNFSCKLWFFVDSGDINLLHPVQAQGEPPPPLYCVRVVMRDEVGCVIPIADAGKWRVNGRGVTIVAPTDGVIVDKLLKEGLNYMMLEGPTAGNLAVEMVTMYGRDEAVRHLMNNKPSLDVCMKRVSMPSPFQCVDLYSWCEKYPAMGFYRCPTCGQDMTLDRMTVDAYFEHILATTQPTVDAMIVSKNGAHAVTGSQPQAAGQPMQLDAPRASMLAEDPPKPVETLAVPGSIANTPTPSLTIPTPRSPSRLRGSEGPPEPTPATSATPPSLPTAAPAPRRVTKKIRFGKAPAGAGSSVRSGSIPSGERGSPTPSASSIGERQGAGGGVVIKKEPGLGGHSTRQVLAVELSAQDGATVMGQPAADGIMEGSPSRTSGASGYGSTGGANGAQANVGMADSTKRGRSADEDVAMEEAPNKMAKVTGDHVDMAASPRAETTGEDVAEAGRVVPETRRSEVEVFLQGKDLDEDSDYD
ncbi:hypothetical protein HK101_009425 [Irineochytrium annulatum]|nr:hypothetical protein HK101_009425 [Irineochytrium annulatum]